HPRLPARRRGRPLRPRDLPRRRKRPCLRACAGYRSRPETNCQGRCPMSAVRTCCPTCGHTHHWSWEEAFDKFGFGDGDDLVMTEAVADALRRHGYAVTVTQWGMHNAIITEI